MRRVVLAESAGFCFGVRRAVNLAEQAAGEPGDCVTLGPIIHNRHVVERLRDLGVGMIAAPEEAVPGSRVIIRSHGAARAVIEALTARGVTVIDATCPDVKKIHRIMENASGQVVMIGKRDHPEVVAACGWCENPLVFESAGELDVWLSLEENRQKPLTVVFQTTLARENMEQCGEILKKWCTSCEMFDTICDATSKRQAEAKKLAEASDAMVVIGDKDSANSRNLAQICRGTCQDVRFIEGADELDLGTLPETIGVIAGASTPAWIIKEVYQTMSEEILRDAEEVEITPAPTEEEAVPVQAEEAEPTPVQAETKEEPVPVQAEAEEEPVPAQAEEDESFEAMLEKSIKTLHTGDKVTCIVTAISPTEISVDLGTKHAGYIPVHELTDELDVNPTDFVEIGKEVEAFVVRVNDVEGTAMLSKKRLDTVKHWEDIEKAVADKTIMEGVVSEENKGGIVVRVKGIRVFVPASQTGIPRDQPMDQLMGKRVKLRITEVNQARRRVVGSIRAVGSEERREQAAKTWAEMENGKRYTGTVKNLAAYGAFVDIGGVDGMVHVSELSWNRIKSPADVLKVGDPIDVYIISFDREKGKISLGHKDPNQNPWKQFTEQFEKGSVATVKIVKLMPFGAFAEVVPGVDGLIHISQIADRRIGRPDEVLSEGQEVQVQITDIDYEKKNVSLSMRALLEDLGASQAADTDEGEAIIEEDVIVYNTDIDKPEPEEAEEVVEVAVEAEEPVVVEEVVELAEEPVVVEEVVELVEEPVVVEEVVEITEEPVVVEEVVELVEEPVVTEEVIEVSEEPAAEEAPEEPAAPQEATEEA